MEGVSDYQTDVLICGGGPGGVACAFTLGKKGINTILVDKKPKDSIGDKVCGDALNPILSERFYNLIGLPKPDPENKELMEVAEVIVLRGQHPKAKLLLGEGSATVDRLRYGQHLLREAESFETVRVIPEARVKDVIVEESYVKGVECLTPDGKITIRAKIVVDATGSSAVVRRRLPQEMCTKFPRSIPREQMLVAYREIIRTKEPHQFQKGLYLTYEPELEDVMPGYYWFFSRGEKELNVGLGYLMEDRNRGKNIRELNESVRRRYFPDAEVLVSQGDQIPARLPLPSLVHNGFLAVGDAGALANPLNGEGHGPALNSGIHAGLFLEKALKNGDWSERGLWPYNVWVWNHYGVEFAMGIALIKFMERYGYEAFEWLVVQGVIREDDILIQLRNPEAKHKGLLARAIKLMKRPKLIFGLRKMISHAEEIKKHAKEYPETPDSFDEWKQKLDLIENKRF